MVTGLHNAERAFEHLDDPPDYSSKTSWKIEKNSINKNPEFMPQFSEINEPSSSKKTDKCQYKLT